MRTPVTPVPEVNAPIKNAISESFKHPRREKTNSDYETKPKEGGCVGALFGVWIRNLVLIWTQIGVSCVAGTLLPC